MQQDLLSEKIVVSIRFTVTTVLEVFFEVSQGHAIWMP